MLRTNFIICALLTLGLFVSTTAHAIIVTFDTLTPTSGLGSDPESTDRNGALTELTISFPESDYVVTITRQSGAAFDLINNTHPRQTGKADYFGSDVPSGNQSVFRSISLDPFSDTSYNGFIFSFNEPINTFSIRAGDFGGDADAVHLYGYTGSNLTGSMVNSGASAISYLFPLASDDSAWTDTRVTLTTEQKMWSVLVLGGVSDTSVFLDRVFFDVLPTSPNGEFPAFALPDNLDDVSNPGTLVTGAIPEPSSLLLLGLAGFAGLIRRR